MHTLFVIDRSGSMCSSSIKPDSRDIRNHSRFSGSLDNVLGVVYEAAYKYIMERASRAPRDVVTFVSFNDGARAEFAAWPVQDSAKMVDQMLQITPTGTTQFNQALKKMHSELMQVWHSMLVSMSCVSSTIWDNASVGFDVTDMCSGSGAIRLDAESEQLPQLHCGFEICTSALCIALWPLLLVMCSGVQLPQP